MNAKPFLAESYDLDVCRLRPLKVDEAASLGNALAAIDPWKSLNYSPQTLAAAVMPIDACDARFGIVVGENAAGVVNIKPGWLRGPYLALLGILPDFQKRGIGKTILCWMEAEARKSGARNMWTAVSSFNDAALEFYSAYGFVQVSRLENLVSEGFDEFLLRKIL